MAKASENEQAATQADKEGGRAFQDGDYDQAWLKIQEARDLDPKRAGLWDAHERRVKLTESQARPPGRADGGSPDPGRIRA